MIGENRPIKKIIKSNTMKNNFYEYVKRRIIFSHVFSEIFEN